MVTDFAGKTALITGAGRGIGRAVALGLADAGAALILVARSTVELAQTQAIVLGRGAAAEQVRIVPADLADEQAHTAADGLTRVLSRRRSRREFPGGQEQSLVVLGARAAAEQVRRDTGVPAGGLGA